MFYQNDGSNHVPGKAQAAQNYLNYASNLRNPPAMFDGVRAESTDLSDKEQECYDAALQVLIDYFKGRVELKEPAAGGGGGDSGPGDRHPVTTG